MNSSKGWLPREPQLSEEQVWVLALCLPELIYVFLDFSQLLTLTAAGR